MPSLIFRDDLLLPGRLNRTNHSYKYSSFSSWFSWPSFNNNDDDEQQEAVVLAPRWNATQLQQYLQNSSHYDPQNSSLPELLRLVPKPSTNSDDVHIYHVHAWDRLRNLLIAPRTIPVRLCSVGGSSTAGGGNIPSTQKWDARFLEMLQVTGISSQPLTSVQVINRAHGSRGSVHAAFVMHSIVPADVDIIIWEFSINDGHPKGCQEINNGIILWLDQIQRMWPQQPPLVILTYLWDPNVALSPDRTLHDTVFQCHAHLAAAYDFVVGSVHLGSYIRNLQLHFNSLRLFLADDHHPNAWGHWFLAYLLWDLVTDTTRRPLQETTTNTTSLDILNGTSPQANFDCNIVPSTKKRVKELLDTKSAFASWTAEVPRNEEDGDFNTGMLTAYLTHVNDTTIRDHHNVSYVISGKSSSWRNDRKRSVVLPCCSSSERLSMDLTSAIPDHSSWTTSAIQVYVPDVSNVKGMARSVSIDLVHSNGTTIIHTGNDDSSTLSSTWISFDSNECRVGHWFLNTWLVLHDPQPSLARLDFCNPRVRCGRENVFQVTMMHVVLY
jgi:hypothetical protein